MKRKIFLLSLMALLLLSGCQDKDGANTPSTPCETHVDTNFDNYCDFCQTPLIVTVDFYAINDLHGKIADGDSHPGVDELTTYLKNTELQDDYSFFLSTGDMWQGSSESNLTNGMLTTDWMNHLDFVGMTLGNHEYDWGEDAILQNDAIAEFPFLAINIYDRETDELVEYCQPSVILEAGEAKIAIIGAMGDCYSSISYEQVKDVYFLVGDELTELVKAEATRLREEEGVDCIIYSIHDGFGSSRGDNVGTITTKDLSSYYDIELSDGYIDLVFEAHTHQKYILKDAHGVYHFQHRGDNSGGISHAELAINYVTGDVTVTEAELVSTDEYKGLHGDAIVSELMDKYSEELSFAYETLGFNSAYRSGDYLCNLVARLYLEEGIEKWGADYDIVLAGGSISPRKPYNLGVGDVNYSDLQSIFPFDNEIALCSISGADLKKRFIDNPDYVIYFSSYGNSIKNNIDPNKTYYIIADTWSSLYEPNKTTEIERYASGIYARDLLAEYIMNGGLK